VHRRLIVAFVVVALVAAVAFQLVVNLLLPLFPALNYLRILPPGILSFLYTRDLSHRGGPQATPFLVLVLGLAAASLLAVITALAFAASRPVLQPVRRLARAAQRMSGGVQRDGRRAGGQGERSGTVGSTGPAVRRRRVP
jgi:hypothetical protein